MRVKSVVFTIFSSIILFVANSFAQPPEEELLCLNNRCFVPESSPETVVLKDTVALNRDVNEDVDEFLEPAFDDQIPYADKEADPQVSKYYSILDPKVPFFKKRFMNVRAWDMTYGTNPEFESSRPNIVLEFINKPEPPAEIDWDNE